ncbi:MAG: TolB family protein [Bacteroidota bacterium]
MPFIKIYSILLILLTIVSCNKDKVQPIEDGLPGSGGDYCPQMYTQRTAAYADSFHKVNNMPSCVVGPEYLNLEEYVYSDPILNPNNAFEFAFIRDEGNSNQSPGWNSELCTYNFCSNEMNILTDVVGYDIDWSAKNWILFTGKDYELYKIKSNGDSLTQLTNTGTWNDNAKWNPDGTKYLYFDADAIRHKICDEEGNLIKDFSNNMAEFDWLNDEKIIFSRSSGSELFIKEYNIETDSEELLYSQPHEGSGEPLSVHDGKVYFTSETGIHVYENGAETLLDSSYFTYTAGYPQELTENKILLQRFITDTTYYPCTVYSTSYISILDVENNTEQYIDIPE